MALEKRISSLSKLCSIRRGLNGVHLHVKLAGDLFYVTTVQTELNMNPPFEKIPVCIRTFIELKQLFLDGCKLKWIQPWIGRLRNLSALSLTRNELKYLPNQICHLSKLYMLHLTKNRLKELPPYLGQLTRLEDLRVVHNELVELPTTIGMPHFFEEDYFRYWANPLRYLPAYRVPFMCALPASFYWWCSRNLWDPVTKGTPFLQPESLLSISLRYVKQNMVY